MNRLLLASILAALLWCGVELRHINRVRYRPAPPYPGPWPTTIHYYVPDGTCINVRNPEGGRE
jgi:hypothetical protein